jgi:YD repeat-containing protein
MTLENLAGAVISYVYHGENRLKKMTLADGTVSTYIYAGDGLRRTLQNLGTTIQTIIWDGSSYLGEI